jgi:hypothetical protein
MLVLLIYALAAEIIESDNFARLHLKFATEPPWALGEDSATSLLWGRAKNALPYWSFGRGDSNHGAPADHLIVKILAMCKTFGHTNEAIEMLRKESALIKKED